MGKHDKKAGRKVETSAARKPAPLNTGAFDALNTLDASLLAPSPEPEPPPPRAPTAPSDGAKTPKRAHVIPPNSKGRVVLRRETKHRAGKPVVIVSGFRDLPGVTALDVMDLAKKLRGRLGVGGSADRNEILLQGDKPAAVAELLRELGYRVEGVVE